MVEIQGNFKVLTDETDEIINFYEQAILFIFMWLIEITR